MAKQLRPTDQYYHVGTLVQYPVISNYLITPYFRDILWKFLHRVLPTKAQLVKCRLVDNSVCLACQSFEESIEHACVRSLH